MKSLHAIMPMAGEGSRFLKIGVNTPKPLITVEGKPLFVRALQGLEDVHVPRKYTFIVRAEHIRNYRIDEQLRGWCPEANIVSVEKTTRGATETCLLASEFVDAADAVVVQDCDLEFYSSEFNRGIEGDLAGKTDVAGRLVSFTATNPRYSFAEINDTGRVLRTAEKDPISNHALAGAYYFASGAQFLELARESVRRYETAVTPSKELYLSLLYNILLEREGRVQLHPLTHYRSFGTPEELEGVDWKG